MKWKVLMALAAAVSCAPAQTGEIRGKITNNLGETVPFATVRVLQDKHLVGGAQSDEHGNYICKPLDPGSYELIVSDAGHNTQPVVNIKVIPNDATYVDVKLQFNTVGEVKVTAKPIEYVNEGIDKNMYVIVSIDGDELRRHSSYNAGNIEGMMEALTSEVVTGSDGAPHFRGARSGASGYFVDGVRTLNAAKIPSHALENVTVFTGGVPAMYGDLSSGVVIITTQSYFSGMRTRNIRQAER